MKCLKLFDSTYQKLVMHATKFLDIYIRILIILQELPFKTLLTLTKFMFLFELNEWIVKFNLSKAL